MQQISYRQFYQIPRLSCFVLFDNINVGRFWTSKISSHSKVVLLVVKPNSVKSSNSLWAKAHCCTSFSIRETRCWIYWSHLDFGETFNSSWCCLIAGFFMIICWLDDMIWYICLMGWYVSHLYSMICLLKVMSSNSYSYSYYVTKSVKWRYLGNQVVSKQPEKNYEKENSKKR